MRFTICLRVGQETVDVEMRQGARSWTTSHTVVAGHLRDTVYSALCDIPRLRWRPRPSVVAVIGPHASRVKRLRGLPDVAGSKALESVVRENASRFFLWNIPFVTTSLYRLGHDEAMGGALDSVVVDAISAGCAEAGYTLRTIHPAEDERLVVKPIQTGEAGAPVTRQRATLAVSAMVVTLLIALLVPGLTAKHTARRAGRELAMLARRERRVEDATSDAHRSEALLGEIGQFEQHRRPATLLLAALADALPPESAVTTVRSDSAGVDLVIVSSRAAGVLGALDRVPGVVGPEIIGPISKELAGTREVERATIHFAYDPLAVKIARKPYAIERQKDE